MPEKQRCWECGFSAANPAWLRYPAWAWRFAAKIRPGWVLACWRHAGQLTFTHSVCGGFIHRADADIGKLCHYEVFHADRPETGEAGTHPMRQPEMRQDSAALPPE